MKRILRSLAPLPALALLLLAGACIFDSTTENPLNEGEEITANIELSATLNGPTDCIHMFAPGEDFPTGKLCDAAARRSTILTVKRGSSYTFRAGKNGTILDTKACRISTGTTTHFSVTWIGAALTCGFGFD